MYTHQRKPGRSFAEPSKDRTFESVVDYFHNYEHDPDGLKHCQGSESNPYAIDHKVFPGGLIQHKISLSYARGHGPGNEPQWFHFPLYLEDGYWLEYGEKCEVPPTDKWNVREQRLIAASAPYLHQPQPYTFQRNPAGQKQRIGAGDWEEATNRYQRKLVRVYDQWAAEAKRQIKKMAARGATTAEMTAFLDGRLPDLEEKLLDAMNTGLVQAVKTSAGSRADLPALAAVRERAIQENRDLVKANLIPNIQASLTAALVGGAALATPSLNNALNAVRSMPAQYAGGYWTTIHESQKGLGTQREADRIAAGELIESVRWDLDPRAVHCKPSAGHYGCPELAGEYPGGWSTLPTVPAGMVTCRGNCVLEGTIIDALDIEAAYRLPYTGSVLEFTSKAGLQLSVTPNHPILTRRGWVKAQFLHEGEDIISGPRSKTILQAVNGNDNYIPIGIEKIFDAFCMADPANRFRHSFIPMPQDFHGDGRFVNGDVDIVRADGQLLNESNSIDFEHSDQFEFGVGSLGQSRLPAQSAGVQILRRPFLSSDSVMGCRADSLAFFSGRLLHSNEHRITSPAWFNTMLQKLVPETTATDTSNQRELLLALARDVTLDKIVNVRHYNYSGHVYDLQSYGSLYNANGILVHNCRCHLSVFRDGQWRREVFDD